MARISRMNQQPSIRRSFWRFSLCELMLLMLAAGAMIGWATVLYRSQRLKPTPFFVNNENWRNDVVQIFQDLGEPPFKDVPGTIMHSDGPGSVQRTMVFRVPLPPAMEQEKPRRRARAVRVRRSGIAAVERSDAGEGGLE